MIYQTRAGKNGRVWFIGKDENDIWVHDPANPAGIYGDFKTFQTSNGTVKVQGPWAATITSMERECA